MTSAVAVVHQRYSTNTFPAWHLAQPFRYLCHNGEINTLKSNVNWMNARQHQFRTDRFGEDISRLFPIAAPGGSDSAVLDNAVELLLHTGRSLPHAMMMLIPEAWQNHETMADDRRAFYEYHACLMEPWDGPAAICFTDGTQVGAMLDRNGLRPCRYTLTRGRPGDHGFGGGGSWTWRRRTSSAAAASSPGACSWRIWPRAGSSTTRRSRRRSPGEAPTGSGWPRTSNPCTGLQARRGDAALVLDAEPYDSETLTRRQQAFGYSLEDLKIILGPMARPGQGAHRLHG